MTTKLDYKKHIKPKLDLLKIKINNPKQYKSTRNKISCTCLKTGCGKNGEWNPRIANLIYKKECCCPECEIKNWEFKTGKNHKNYKGFEGITYTFWNSIKLGAKNRGHLFKITIEYAWKIFLIQKQKCKYTNILITLGNSKKYRKFFEERTASLDQIIPGKGYIVGNVQWVHKDINKMKWDFSEKQFLKYCQIIYENLILRKF